MEIKENVPLKGMTTMNVGGEARYMCHIVSVDDLREAFHFIQKESLPFFVLGGGSNIVFSDSGFSGVVLKMEIGGIEYADVGDAVRVTAGAGVIWDDLVSGSVSRGLWGLENLSFVPGTVGAAPVQNIGAYGVEAKDYLHEVGAFNRVTGAVEFFSNEKCSCGYRDSFFKKDKEKKYIVVNVTFRLLKKGIPNLSYGNLCERLNKKNIQTPTVSQVRDEIIAIRREKLPSHTDGVLGSAGSFFKNPIIKKDHCESLMLRFPEMPFFDAGEGKVKIPAGWLIDNVCHMRGIVKGSVGTYERQALVIVNHGKATSTEIKNFEEEIVRCVKEKTGIALEREVEYVDNE